MLVKQWFLNMTPKNTNKVKNIDKLNTIKNLKLSCKPYYQESKITTQRMREYICKSYI